MKPKILLVEDSPFVIQGMKDMLEDDYELLIATSLDEAATAIQKHESIAAICFDGDLNGENTYSTKAAGTIGWAVAQGFNGIMIACSANSISREKQLAAGCQHETDSKDEIPALLDKIFKK